MKGMLDKIATLCPRSIGDGAGVMRAVIEQGLGWGSAGKSFVLCIKSWSGAIGVHMLADAARESAAAGKGKGNGKGAGVTGGSFREHI